MGSVTDQTAEDLNLSTGKFVAMTVEGYLVQDGKQTFVRAGGLYDYSWLVKNPRRLEAIPDPNHGVPVGVPLIDPDGDLWVYGGTGEWRRITGQSPYPSLDAKPIVPTRPLRRVDAGEVVAS